MRVRSFVCVDVSVWMLIRVEKIVTAAHRDLQSCMHMPTNEPWSRAKNEVSLRYFTGQNRPLKKWA